MKKIYKALGVAALLVTLICNLQYSFFDANKNPNAAKAEWTYTDPSYLTTTIFCGSAPDMAWYPGVWYHVEAQYVPPEISWVDPYDQGYWYFVPDQTSTTQCGLNQPSTYPGFNHNGWEITAPNPPSVAY